MVLAIGSIAVCRLRVSLVSFPDLIYTSWCWVWEYDYYPTLKPSSKVCVRIYTVRAMYSNKCREYLEMTVHLDHQETWEAKDERESLEETEAREDQEDRYVPT